MKVSELLRDIEIVPVGKGRNLRFVGWARGYLLVQFWGHPDRYVYGPAVPEVEKDKILRVPYPDALFDHNIKKRYQCYKVK